MSYVLLLAPNPTLTLFAHVVMEMLAGINTNDSSNNVKLEPFGFDADAERRYRCGSCDAASGRPRAHENHSDSRR